MRTEYKEMSWRNLKPNDIIKEFKYGNIHSFGRWKVVELNVSRIGLQSLYGENNPVNYYSTADFTYMIPYTEEELRERYYKDACEVVKTLQNTINHDAIGNHEMWNAWIGTDAYEFAQNLKHEQITLLGVCYDITYKENMYDTYDVAIVCEYEDGERFWCHYKSEWLKNIFDEWGVKR